MRKNQSYSPALKMCVVNEYLAGKTSLACLAKKYNILSKRQVSTWIKRYEEHGAKYFKEEHRGRSIDKSSISKDEYIRYLEMENAILKKAKALMQSDRQLADASRR
jgi:transposase-like protein